MTLGRFELSAGAALILALLYYLDSDGTMAWVLLGCALHEAGHWLAIRALGGRVTRLRLTWAGAELRMSPAHPLTPGRMALCALAGPAVNLALAWGAAQLARRGAGERLYLFAGVDLGLAVFNLLPAEGLDGGRALRCAAGCLHLESVGEWLCPLCSDVVAALLLGGGAVLLWQSGGENFTLLVCGLWMLAMGRRGNGWMRFD